MSQTFPLSLRPLGSPAHKPAAWFIAGASEQAWVEELAGWGVPLAGLKLYVVPTSLRDRRPIGVLVTAADRSPPNAASLLRARPYGRVSDRLYLPVDTALDPPVSDDELRSKLLWKVCVLHPSAGLVGFDDGEALAVHDLLAPPARRPVDWDRAVPGPPAPPQLLSVEPDLPPVTVRMILDEGRDDIGSEAPDELPKQPKEGAARDALSKAARPPLQALSWLAGHAPRGATHPTWINHLKDWADRKLAGISAALAEARFRELKRLQEMLRRDPDKGLRYAIPVSGLGQTRGAAPPGASLSPRNVDFNLGRLGGGRAGDAWQVPWEIRQQLMAQYREAANRELALGRYRRAAYVFAELLGDLASAANALTQGRHYREAAVLYRERLQNPAAAAECLEPGGLLTEAVVLYEQLRQFEKAAELYGKLERPDDARRCYREAVEKAKTAGRYVEVAKLLETKLDAADEALGLLDSTWPNDDAAGACLREWFELLGRLGRHEQASRRLAALRGDAPPPLERTAVAVQVIGSVAAEYPDAPTRALAADVARVVTGRRLPAVAPSVAQALLEVVARLAPHDRLLQRDTSRYLSRSRPQRPLLPPAQQPLSKGPFLMDQIRLHEHAKWNGFASVGDMFFGHGEIGDQLYFVRGRWDGMTQGIYWDPERGAAAHAVEPSPTGNLLMVLPLGVRALPRAKFFPLTDAFRTGATATTPTGLPGGNLLGGCIDEGGTAWFISDSSIGHILSAMRSFGTLAGTWPILLPDEADGRIHMAARNGNVFVASGRMLLHRGPAGSGQVDSLPRPATSLAAAAPFTRVRVAVAMEEGGVVYWEDGDQRPFAEGMASPAVGFTRGGMLVAVSAGIGRVYRLEGKTLKLHSSFASFSQGGAPVAVTPTHLINHFAVFMPDGLVRVFQVGS